jgi:hypothetical protein
MLEMMLVVQRQGHTDRMLEMMLGDEAQDKSIIQDHRFTRIS